MRMESTMSSLSAPQTQHASGIFIVIRQPQALSLRCTLCLVKKKKEASASSTSCVWVKKEEDDTLLPLRKVQQEWTRTSSTAASASTSLGGLFCLGDIL
jgi:hypothetical protein